MVLRRPLQGHRVQILQLGVLEVQLHKVWVAGGEDELGDTVGRLEVVRRGMIEIVEEGLEGEAVCWRTDLAGQSR